MANKSVTGCFIGFDTMAPQLKVMRAAAPGMDSVQIDYLPYDEELAQTDNFSGMITSALKNAGDLSRYDKDNVFLVLPDRAVCIDMINIPNLSRFKVQGALKVESEEMYRNYKDLQISYFQVMSGKSYSTYGSVVVRKSLIKDIEKALGEFKFNLKATTYASNCDINSVLQLQPKNKAHNFIFADIKENETVISVCSKAKTIGFMSIPFGYSILESEEVVSEYTLWNHDMAELAVLNATELAKAKKQLTTAAVEEEPETSAENAENTDEEEPAPYLMKDSDAEYGLDEDEIEAEKLRQQQEAAKNKVKKFVRKAKKYPKFMQREIPETPEGMIMENFRCILKWLLLCKTTNDHNANLHNPEFILLNIPQKYAYLADELNKDTENKANFKYLDTVAGNETVAKNLDLFGGLFMKQFNPYSNF